MSWRSPRLVVRRSLPGGGWMVRGMIAIGLLVFGALLFELGLRQLGYPRLEVGQEAARARDLAELRRRNDSLRARIQLLETTREIDREAYRLLEASLEQLQEDLLRTERELQFYQGIVAPEDGLPAGLRIHRFQVLEQPENRYLLRMVLVQALTREEPVAGSLSVRFEGRRGEERLSFALADLVPENQSVVDSFSFRYFQELGQELVLPDGITVESVEVEIQPSGGGGSALREAFDWRTAVVQQEGT